MQLTKNFKLEEFACHDGTPVPAEYLPNVQELANNLQVLRDDLGKPIVVISGYRTPDYNDSHGGKLHSQHKLAKAGDIQVKGMTPKQLHDRIEALIASGKMKQGGLGLYPAFVHYDVRGTAARWIG
jgi:uncharacterized protein YcbK (DUF882 family)